MPACGGEQQPHMTLPSYIQKSLTWNWYNGAASFTAGEALIQSPPAFLRSRA
jgi:hypothetical protein